MEVFVGISLSLSLLLLGISLGAIIENKRIKTAHSIETINLRLRETQEILLPLADKITHHDMRDQSIGGSTMVDYRWQDPDKTLEIPVYELLVAELKLKEEKWYEEQTNSDV